jgi:hypothetical protein
MVEQREGIAKRTVRGACSWLYGMAFRRGWPRWFFLGVVATVFFIIAVLMRDGVDYRGDPSMLVPRSAMFYAETNKLPLLLEKMSGWPVWRELPVASDQWSHIHVALAEMLGAKVAGLGARLPLGWIGGAEKAALAIVAGDNGDPESWAVYLSVADAEKKLESIRLESDLTLLRAPGIGTPGVYELAGRMENDGVLFVGVMGPWLVIASDSRLPVFALDTTRSFAFSLGRSGMLQSWRRGMVFRGAFNPTYFSGRSGSGPLSTLAGWMSPDARWGYTGETGRDGAVELRLNGGKIAPDVGDGGVLWPVVKILLSALAVLCLILLLGTVSVMIGLGGWYKYLAMRAGISPRKMPASAEPSRAFAEDVGLEVESKVVEQPAPESPPAEHGTDEQK